MPSARRGFSRRVLRGFSIVPLLSPVRSDRSLDGDAVRRLVDHIVAGGCQGLMLGGTTGEGPSMSVAMRLALFETAVAHVAGRATVFAGIGDTSFQHSIALADAAFAFGADAVVAQLPAYYVIGPAEIEAYFRALADRVSGSMYLYNIPQTTRVSVPLDVVARLSTHPRIVGIKDSEADATRQEQLAAHFAGREDFAVFCGSIAVSAAAMRAGADGFVPSVGNIAPGITRAAMDRWFAGDATAATAAFERVAATSRIYQQDRTLGESIAALKAATEAMGLGSRHVLPPLRDCTDADVAGLRDELQRLNLIP
jgi:4-hydroxy-tetrahydrodipicolinate synthase